MKCANDSIFDSNCCPSAPKVPTQFEDMFSTYYSCAKPIIDSLISQYYSANIFGKPGPVLINIDKINDIHLLFGYLTAIYVGILEDQENDPCGKAQSVSVYYDENKIDCIKAAFLCKGINISSLLAVFGLDDRNALQLFDGINFMCIEVCNPQDPACDNDDEVFTVNKPI